MLEFLANYLVFAIIIPVLVAWLPIQFFGWVALCAQKAERKQREIRAKTINPARPIAR